MAASLVFTIPAPFSKTETIGGRPQGTVPSLSWVTVVSGNSSRIKKPFPCLSVGKRRGRESRCSLSACLSSSTPTPPYASPPKTRLYVSGLSFRTTEESLRKAFQNFGQLVDVNLVMDKIANRPRGFAFLRYETEEESQKAIEGMHGKFLDGRVIFVEFAKKKSELRKANRNSQSHF